MRFKPKSMADWPLSCVTDWIGVVVAIVLVAGWHF